MAIFLLLENDNLGIINSKFIKNTVIIRGGSGEALGAQAPPTTKNEAPAPKFYKIEAPEWQF